MRFWDWPADQTVEQTHDIARLFVNDMEAGVALYWTARAEGEFVGVFDLSALDNTSADLGFMVARRHWGQGFATEAAAALIEKARHRGLTRLHARCHADNVASRRLLQKLGFCPAGAESMVAVAPGRSILCAFFSLDLAEA